MKKKVLVIEDEKGILEVLSAYLEKEGYEVHGETNGAKGYDKIMNLSPDFVILDLMLPGMSGEEICKKTRETSDVPIMMLTAKREEIDRLTGLSLGADDYVVKPFSPKEIVLRTNAILRRVKRDLEGSGVLSFDGGDLLIDTEGRIVKKAGSQIEITRNEFDVLLALASGNKRIFSREKLIEVAFGYEYDGYDRTVDTYIKNIRKKIDTDRDSSYIQTVYGVGYRFAGEK